MSNNKKKYVLEKIKYVEESQSKHKSLFEKTERTEVEEQEKNYIEYETKKIIESPNVVKRLPVDTLVFIEKIIHTSNNFVAGLDFTPTYIPNQNKRYSNDTGYSVLTNYTNNIFDDKIRALSNKTKGIDDDVTSFNGKPNISIHRQSSNKPFGGVIHTTPVGNEYIISFEFNLLRFPSKVTQNSLYSNQMKQLTTRRSELICFRYGEYNEVIEFAAMAPQGKLNNSSMFKNKYSPFSLAVSFPFAGNCSNSIYTDYKFELNTNYLVKLRMTSEDGGELSQSNFIRYELFVNNLQEDVVFTHGKVWGETGKMLKKQGVIPSQPGFLNIYNQDFSETKPRFPISKDVFVRRPFGFNLNKLIFIYSAPYSPKIKFLQNYNRDTLYKTIFNRYLYKSNTGIEFGKINIYYSKVNNQ